MNDLVYWVTGVIAACGINESNTNRAYDGEFEVYTKYTQEQLSDAIKAGEFVLHRVGDKVCVLKDINSLLTVTPVKGNIFKNNQSIRVADEIANSIAYAFNTQFLGVMPNDAAGRLSLQSAIVNHHRELERIRAIENFDPADVTVVAGGEKYAVLVNDKVNVVNQMEQMYMNLYCA